MKNISEKRQCISRRTILKGGAALGASVLSAPYLANANELGPLKVATYGGYFQDSFDQHIFPDFTKETGIEIESITSPTSEAWLIQLQQAARAGQAPADVSMIAQTQRIKGARTKLWQGLDPEKIPNAKNLADHFVNKDDDGKLIAVGAVSWYVTLVTNIDTFTTAPSSWKELWNPENADKLGLLALPSNSFLLEVTAKTWFGSTDILSTEEGILQVMDKLAELKPNVRLWYRDEGQFQQALETGEIPMGQYYHDVTGLAASEGKPVRSTFPAEGGVLDSGAWCVSKASKQLEASEIFINYMCQPSIQAKLARFVGTAPTVDRVLMDLTDEEFDAVSSWIDPIIPRYDMHDERADWVNQKWSELIVG